MIAIRPQVNYPSGMNAILKPSAPPVDLDSAAAAQAALRSFWRICEAWQLDATEQTTLLGVGRTTLYQWKRGLVSAGLDRHVLERLSYLFGIYAALQILLPVAQQADGRKARRDQPVADAPVDRRGRDARRSERHQPRPPRCASRYWRTT